jgi:1-phosphofructokinase
MNARSTIATVTLNPAIDQTLSIPGFTPDSVNRVQDFRCDAGGKGINAAAFLADYGLPVTATGFLGNENTHVFEGFFRKKNITDRFVRIAGSTRTGIKIVDDRNQTTTDINFPGLAPTPADRNALLQIIDRLCDRCDWFVLGGSIPSGMPTTIYAELLAAITRKGAKVALDASGEGLRQALPAAPVLVKPNIDELQELYGHSLSTQGEIIDAAHRMLDQGLRTVIVSMGEQGALFVEANHVIRAVPPRVQVKSTVGAGDAMLSGMLVGKIENRSLEDCARLATAFSVIAVTTIGAGLPSVTALESIQPQVTITHIKA